MYVDSGCNDYLNEFLHPASTSCLGLLPPALYREFTYARPLPNG